MSGVSQRFSPLVLERLIEGGWHDGRSVDRSIFEESLSDYPDKPHAAALSFLCEFWETGLRSASIEPEYGGFISFGLPDEDEFPLPAFVRRAEERFGALFPVGDDRHLRLILVMSFRGQVFGYRYAAYRTDDDEQIFLIGQTPEEAIENLCFGPERFVELKTTHHSDDG